MDLSKIKNKLSELNTSSNQKEKVDYDKVYWKPDFGKHQIRIVPSAYDPTFPFTELKFHYNIGEYPMIALSNFGQQDPIEDFVAELKKTSDKDNWSLAGRLTPKSRFFAPVLVRGEEDKGIRLWSFGVTIFKSLLSLAEDEDIGDYTDVVNGFDMVVEKVKGNPYPETTIRIKPRMSPLHDDNSLVNSWLKDQPNPREVFTKFEYDYIKNQLQNYLNPNSKNDDATPEPVSSSSSESEEVDEGMNIGDLPGMPAKNSNFSLNTENAEKRTPVSKFDDLFNE